MSVGYGLCECGCGQSVSVAPCSDKRWGWIKGAPIRFAKGHKKRKDLTGKTFGKYTVISFVMKNGRAYWKCACSCGFTKDVREDGLLEGRLLSCRTCVNVDHGHARTNARSSTYRSWRSMITRCTNRAHDSWKHYGGALPPVTVCSRWMKFKDFLMDMGERPKGTTISRLLDSGNYEPSNCIWHTPTQQWLERKRKVR